jgi:ACS family hexuronate transporter-like MFS transporter
MTTAGAEHAVGSHPAAQAPPAPTALTPNLRWLLFGILCLAGISNALDRQIISLLKTEMSTELGWDDETYGRLAAYFQIAAATAFLFTGWLVDKLGVKWGNIIGVAAWSIAAAAHGLATTAWHFVACRIGLGATEAMGTPLTIKTVASIFPANQRSLAIGLQTLIAAVGLVSMPFLIPWLNSVVGWRGAFIVAGLAGVVIIALWLMAVRGVRFDDGAELARIDFADGRQAAVRCHLVAVSLLAARLLSSPIRPLGWEPRLRDGDRLFRLRWGRLPLGLAVHQAAGAGLER